MLEELKAVAANSGAFLLVVDNTKTELSEMHFLYVFLLSLKKEQQ